MNLRSPEALISTEGIRNRNPDPKRMSFGEPNAMKTEPTGNTSAVAEVVGAERPNGSAFEAVYEAHAPAIYRYVFFRTGRDPTIASELTAEVFTAFLGCDPLNREAALVLHGIARRKVSDHFRRMQRKPEVRFTDLKPEDRRQLEAFGEGSPDGFSNQALPDAACAALGNVFTNLPSETQELLLDKYVRNRSVRMMAQQRGMSEAAVMSALARARKQLREKVGRELSKGERR